MSKLYDNFGRWYSPTLGRFTSVDLLGLGPDVNAYRYLGNGPVNFTDPSGLQSSGKVAVDLCDPRDPRRPKPPLLLDGDASRPPKPPPIPWKPPAPPYQPSMSAVSEAEWRRKDAERWRQERHAYEMRLQNEIAGFTFSFTWLPAPGNILGSPARPQATRAPGGPRVPLPALPRIPLPVLPNPPTTRTPFEILMPGGSPIGRPGSSAGIRRENGGLPAAQKMFDELAAGGRDVTPLGYPGKRVELPGPGGGYVGLRPKSSSKDESPSLDVDIPGIPLVKKIHFEP